MACILALLSTKLQNFILSILHDFFFFPISLSLFRRRSCSLVFRYCTAQCAHSFWFNYAFRFNLSLFSFSTTTNKKKKKTQVPKDDENEWKNEMWMHDDGAASKGKAIQHEKEWVIQSAFRFIALSSTSSLSTVSEIFSNGNEVFHFSTSTSAQFRNFRFHFANGKNIEAYVWGARTTCIRQNIQMDTKWRKVAQAHQALAPVSPAPK